MNLHQKLIEVRKVVPYLQKENSGSQYKYVSSSQVLSNVISKLNELGVLLVPAVVGHKLSESAIEYYDSEGRVNKRTTTYFTELDMTMTWVNSEKPDESISVSWYGQGVDIAGEKGVGKALTYAEKYFMLKFFNVATDKDDPDSFQEKNNESGKSPKPEPTSNNKPQESKSEKPSGATIQKCADCLLPIGSNPEQAEKVKGWCESHKAQFQNKVLCQKCQQNYKQKAG